MSISGFDLAQARYDATSPPDGHECDDPDCDGQACEQAAREAWEDAQIERADARRKGDEYA